MASQHIEIPSTASRLSADVRSAIDRLVQLQADWQDAKDVMDQVAYGGDYAALALKLGVTEGEATAVYNLWGSANEDLTRAFLTQVAARLG